MERAIISKIHVLLLPALAFGHLIPFHQLAVALANAGVYVSYISTPKNIQRLPKHLKNASINFVSLPLPVLDSNPFTQGAEATVDVPEDQIQYLTKAFHLLRKPLEKFVLEHSPDWLVVDFVAPWATDVGKACAVPVLGFFPFSAPTMLFFCPPEYLTGDEQKRDRSSLESLTSPPKWVTFPSSVAYRRFEAAGRVFSLAIQIIAMVSEEGQGMWARAREAAAIFGERRLHDQYIAEFAEYLKHEAVKQD